MGIMINGVSNQTSASQAASSGEDQKKEAVRCATTAALAANTRAGNVLTANANGALGAIDGVTLAVGERLLVKDEATGANNGIYSVTDIGSAGTPWILTRATDANGSTEIDPGTEVFVDQGTAWSDTVWALTTNAPITINTTALVFSPVALANGVIWRRTLAADSALAADVIGATTETIHTAISVPAAILAVARRSFRIRASLLVVSSNGADTWRIRLRIGGVAGALLFDGGAIDIANGNVFVVNAEFQLSAVGAGGTLIGQGRMYNPVGSAFVVNGDDNAAVDTTAARDLVVTGECSSNNAGNQVTLKHFEVEALAA